MFKQYQNFDPFLKINLHGFKKKFLQFLADLSLRLVHFYEKINLAQGSANVTQFSQQQQKFGTSF